MKTLSGILLLCAWASFLANQFLGLTLWFAGVFAWISVFFLVSRLEKAAKRQSTILYSAGIILLIYSYLHHIPINLKDVFLPNLNMVSMFIAVSTLNLATSNLSAGNDKNWTGLKGLFSSLASVSFLGAVINISVLFVVGNRLMVNGTITRQQAILLSRVFACAAFWSPFFVAMAVALTFSPGMNFFQNLPFGLAAVLGALIFTGWDIWRMGVHQFEGYPLKFQTLKLPLILSSTVLFCKWLWPSLSIIAIIALFAPIISIALMPKIDVMGKLKSHVTERLPSIGNQVVLFLGAGLLAAGIHGLTQIWSLAPVIAMFGHYNWMAASAVTVTAILIGYLGVHPIILISSMAPLLVHLHPDPTLLGMTFLFCWGLSTAVTPLSGANLALIACYRLKALNMLKWNAFYAFRQWLWMSGIYFVYDWLYLR